MRRSQSKVILLTDHAKLGIKDALMLPLCRACREVAQRAALRIVAAITIALALFAAGAECGAVLPPARTASSERPDLEQASWAGESPHARERFFDDVVGIRPPLEDSGVRIDATATEFYQGITRGGLSQSFEFGGRNDYYVSVEGGQAGLWDGFQIDLHGETRYGQSVTQTGAQSSTDTAMRFPVPDGSVTALTGVKFTQTFDEQLLVSWGKINVLDGYVDLFAAGKGQTQFLNNAFVVPPIRGRTIPYSSLGLRLGWLHGEHQYLSVSILDAVNHPTTSGFEDAFANGVTMFGELNVPVHLGERRGYQHLLFSWSNQTVTALSPAAFLQTPVGPIVTLPQVSNSWSLLYKFDQYVYTNPADSRRGWGVFGQLGLSDGNPNPIRWSCTVGIGGAGILDSRPEDTFGFGFYFMQVSSELRDLLANVQPVQNESGLELYYNVAITKWFHVTPDVQWINPTLRSADNATVIGVRAHLQF